MKSSMAWERKIVCTLEIGRHEGLRSYFLPDQCRPLPLSLPNWVSSADRFEVLSVICCWNGYTWLEEAPHSRIARMTAKKTRGSLVLDHIYCQEVGEAMILL